MGVGSWAFRGKGAFFGLLLLGEILCAPLLRADTDFTILQTADIHSHFLNNDSPFKLGGIARLATEIQNIRKQKTNVLVLDAGDFTEGSIFFTYNHGLATYQIMQNIGYDAMVLGNHDWLVGPQELFNSLENSQFQIPILSSNLDMSGLDKGINLQKYIKPYVVKQIGGIKIGILGLSTFQFVFDRFFLPVKLVDPVVTAQKYVTEMRQTEGCQVIIILSHLGFSADQNIAQSVPGVDLIVGGHSHVLIKNLYSENNIPITHVGKWGQYLGDLGLSFGPKGLSLNSYQIHQISEDIDENPYIKTMVEGDMAGIENKQGPLFHNVALVSEVDLPLKDFRSDDIAGHWAADAMREFTHSDVAFENPSYVSRDIFKGETTWADFFNIFPHIYNPSTNKAWTVKTFKITGAYAQLLVSAVYRAGIYLRLSNAKAVLDLYQSVDQLHSLEIAGEPVDPNRVYTVAGTSGVTDVIDILQSYGIDVGVTEEVDTGVEAWRMLADYFHKMSPISQNKLVWEGRVRTLQPDVTVRPEELSSVATGPHEVTIIAVVRNTGMNPATGSQLSLVRAQNPGDTLSDRKVEIAGVTSALDIKDLAPGEAQEVKIIWNTSGLAPGRYAVTYSLTPAVGELEIENNVLDSYLDVP